MIENAGAVRDGSTSGCPCHGLGHHGRLEVSKLAEAVVAVSRVVQIDPDKSGERRQ